MIKNDTRESAHLKSRVKDLSVVPNLVSFTGLFTAITPIAKIEKNPATGLYDPILIRDTDSLIANFGDPRIDPEKYIDLYSIMQVVGNGTCCYVAKVDSGETGVYEYAFVGDPVIDTANKDADILKITNDEGHPVAQEERKATIDDLHNRYVISDLKGGAIKASGTITFNGLPEEDDTVTINGTAFTFKLDASGSNEITIGSTAKECASNLANKTPADVAMSAKDEVVTITASTAGINGNSIGISCISDSISLSGDTLTGGKNAGWPIDKTLYTVEHDSVDNTHSIHITLSKNTDLPENVVIGTADLDPEYGREGITLVADPANDKEYYSNPLSREYTILQVMDGSDPVGSDMYTVKWEAEGDKYKLRVVFNGTVTNPEITAAARLNKSLKAFSSMSEDLDIKFTLTQAKPYSLKLFYLNAEATSNGNTLGSAKIRLEPTTTNQQLVNNLNSSLQTYARFELADADTKAACEITEGGKNSIVKALLDQYAPYVGKSRKDLESNPRATELPNQSVLSKPNFKVQLQNYIDSQELYRDKKYVGCIMADMCAPVTHTNGDDGEQMVAGNPKAVMPLDHEERRALHYYLKQVACERKDSTVILSTPLTKGHKDPNTYFTQDEICNWVASLGDYSDLWEYGSGNTTDYSIQSFYLEIYYSWLNMQCTKIENGLAKSVKVKVPPSCLVINNILTSWRERGIQYPVAGDQYGTLPDTCTIIQNPKAKLDRDQLVQYRINPIWDTGTRGIQIYGNETLNAGYTDLNAAHIARTLVYIRSRVDEYTETLKFLINSQILWDTWKNYVTMRILQPLQSVNAIATFRVTMGNDTTSREEIANRMIKGNVELTFYQSAEIFDLSFIVYSSATTVDEANPL